MSVLIKNMKMPTSCRACHLKMNCDDCEGLECVCVPLHQEIGYLDDLLTDKRRDDCPLIPILTHGRLIDADAVERNLVKMQQAQTGACSHGVRKSRAVVRDMPTIIPADPPKEDE